MPIWVCPKCQRQFARKGQGHECAPAMTLEEYFSTGPPFERPIFEAVMAGLEERVGPIHVEPVSVGIFLKRARGFSELRPMTKWVAVSFALPRTISSARISRKVYDAGATKYHVVNVRTPDEVDDQLLDWLAEAYHASPE
ncbi:MAG: DUF5655 domain-containing protein [Acidimicrobiales bacterium]